VSRGVGNLAGVEERHYTLMIRRLMIPLAVGSADRTPAGPRTAADGGCRP
jgi:hypothetical protein